NEAEANPDVFALNTEPGSHLLLCTDGLTNLVSGEEILATIQTLGADPEACASRLVELANEAGGFDNITVIVGSI
ncbi:MAG: serine/threonine-protein phosphatase, partial [Ruminococcaceae bacterium]|nr:serine/threonine-protein phosphatase [Oscillospiraceae bacterium]